MRLQFLVYYSPEEQAIKLDQKEKSTLGENAEEGILIIPEEEVQEENNETTNQAGKPNANVNPKPSQNVPVKTGDQAPIVLTSVLLIGSAAILLLLKLRKNNK